MCHNSLFLFSDRLTSQIHVILSRSLLLDMLQSTSIQASPKNVLLRAATPVTPSGENSISLQRFINCIISLLLHVSALYF